MSRNDMQIGLEQSRGINAHDGNRIAARTAVGVEVKGADRRPGIVEQEYAGVPGIDMADDVRQRDEVGDAMANQAAPETSRRDLQPVAVRDEVGNPVHALVGEVEDEGVSPG